MQNTLTKETEVVIASVNENGYKDLEFVDMEGNSYKISAKRTNYFKDKIVRGNKVTLQWAMSSFGKEYIYAAQIIDSQPLPKEEIGRGESPVEVPAQSRGGFNSNPTDKRSREISENMAIKEIGELVRSGHIVKVFGTKAGELLKHYQDFILINSGLFYEEKDLPKIKGGE